MRNCVEEIEVFISKLFAASKYDVERNNCKTGGLPGTCQMPVSAKVLFFFASASATRQLSANRHVLDKDAS